MAESLQMFVQTLQKSVDALKMLCVLGLGLALTLTLTPTLIPTLTPNLTPTLTPNPNPNPAQQRLDRLSVALGFKARKEMDADK